VPDPLRLHLQPQPPPQQPVLAWTVVAAPPTETVDSSFTVSSWPAGQEHGAEASLIGRESSKVAPQVRQRYS
jgi:hypothetical protein